MAEEIFKYYGLYGKYPNGTYKDRKKKCNIFLTNFFLKFQVTILNQNIFNNNDTQ